MFSRFAPPRVLRVYDTKKKQIETVPRYCYDSHLNSVFMLLLLLLPLLLLLLFAMVNGRFSCWPCDTTVVVSALQFFCFSPSLPPPSDLFLSQRLVFSSPTMVAALNLAREVHSPLASLFGYGLPCLPVPRTGSLDTLYAVLNLNLAMIGHPIFCFG